MDASRGQLICKPEGGWLHGDDQLAPLQGVLYGVRYIGCMEIKQSMKTLDFDTRTAVAKESISRVCDAAGMKTASKKSKRGTKISKLLGDQPNMVYAGANVNLTITTESLTIMNMETGEVIGNHLMPGISFASGGDPDTMDFVAYVAKDEAFGRACHVLECGGGLAQDVITTIGQSFELRFKQYLANRPEAVSLPDKLENPVFGSNGDAWGDDDEKDYYNDRVGARPPSPPHYAAPPCNLPVSDGVYNSVKDPSRSAENLGFENNFCYDNSKDGVGAESVVYDNPSSGQAVQIYDNPRRDTIPVLPQAALFDNSVYDNEDGAGASAQLPPYLIAPTEVPPLPQRFQQVESLSNGHAASSPGAAAADATAADPFDMTPFCSSLPIDAKPPTDMDVSRLDTRQHNSTNSINISIVSGPYNEPWFHGKISRQLVEMMLLSDGDFLVRESANSPGQFVLSGKQGDKVKHLLLVDPEGIVRTKDRTFDSIGHLLKYHMDNKQPITSNDSELLLKTPVFHSTG